MTAVGECTGIRFYEADPLKRRISILHASTMMAMLQLIWSPAPEGVKDLADQTSAPVGDDPLMHTRIRKFNTKDTYPEQRLDNDLCQAVVARGSTVFVRGQVGQDLDTSESVSIGDPVGQTERAMANISTLLEEAGAKLEHICKITIYLTDPRFREQVYRTIGRWLRGVYPVSTGIVVSALARPEWLVEVDVIAVIPEGDR